MEISGREVSDEIFRKVIGAAFKAPTNDHLRQLEFVVVRGGEYAACGRKRRLGRGVPHPRGRRGRQHKESGQCPRRLRVCLSSHNRLSRRKRFSPKAEGNQYRGQNTCECLVTGKNETEGAQSGMDIYFPMRAFRKFSEHSAGFGVLSYCLQRPRRQNRRGGREKAL